MAFQKGVSGNPGGRPKAIKDWREKCIKFMEGEKGWQQLMDIALGRKDPANQLKALQFIAEHAYGKASQYLANDPEDAQGGLSIVIKRDGVPMESAKADAKADAKPLAEPQQDNTDYGNGPGAGRWP